MRVADLVEQHDDDPTRQHSGAAQHVLEVRLCKWLDGERQPLMNGAVRQQPCKIVAIEHAYRFTVSAPERCCGCHQSARLLLVPGEHGEPVPAPFGIGERRGDRMATVDPALGCGPVGGGTG